MGFLYRYFYTPSFWQKILAYMLVPISLVYCAVATFKRNISKKQDFGVPIISVGNLIAGGSGKTPFIIQIALFLSQCQYGDICVISRGYKRKSKGLVWVSHKGVLLCDVKQAGDEAYLIAKSCKDISVIVCNNRKKAIKEAISKGVKIILLDDAFRFNFVKMDIILRPKNEPHFRFCLPSGIYRESPKLYESLKHQARPIKIAQESKDFHRYVKIENQSPKMLLLTAIANPARLDEFLVGITDKIVGKITLRDHSDFNKDDLLTLMQKFKATSLLVTTKDAVKLENFELPLSIMELFLEIESHILNAIKSYIMLYISPKQIPILVQPKSPIFLSAHPKYNVLNLFMKACPNASKLDLLEVIEYLILQSLDMKHHIWHTNFWLPHRNDLAENFSYDAEAIEMIGELFIEQMIDIKIQNQDSSLILSLFLPQRHKAWEHFRDMILYSSPSPIIDDRTDFNDIWNPKNWSNMQIFMGRTSKGDNYFSFTLAPRFYEKYRDITLEL